MLGSTTTGLVLLLSKLTYVDQIYVYAPLDSRIPPGFDTGKVRVIRSWKYDSPRTLGVTAVRILSQMDAVDVFLFNIHLTSFGTSGPTNALGLSIPPLVARLSRRPVVVVMHNFIETQDITKLGYNVGRFSRVVASLLEKVVLSNTHGIVPLESQRIVLEQKLGVKLRSFPLRFVEAYYSASRLAPHSSAVSEASGGRVESKHYKILLFGTWGPQKDLQGAIEAILPLVEANPRIDVTIAGETNLHFPDFRATFESYLARLPSDRFRYVGSVPEDEVASLFTDHNLLILPYNETGGYSAVLNSAALVGTNVVAYDHPQLREQSRDLGIDVSFVPVRDASALRRAVEGLVEDTRGEEEATRVRLVQNMRTALDSVDRIGRYLQSVAAK